MSNKIENGKDKIIGKVKEMSGKMTKDEDLEFKGKLQVIKADIGNKVEGMKEEVLDKANDFLDKVKENKKY